MFQSKSISLYLAAVVALSSNPRNAQGFSVLPRPQLIQTSSPNAVTSNRHSSSPLSLWKGDQEFDTPSVAVPVAVSSETQISDLEAQAKHCLLTSSCDVEYMSMLLGQLEDVQNNCTEEGNQTDDACDVALKAEREALIYALEEKITNTVASTMVMFMSTSPTAEDQVRACLDGSIVLTMKQMEALLQELETLNNDCTEEGRQTLDECDVAVKAERDALAKKLERKISSPDMNQIQNCLETGKCSLRELTHMLSMLEKHNYLCTEEGNQTNDECDVFVMGERLELMEVLSEQITKKQSESIVKTKNAMHYKLCDTTSLTKTLQDLEELTSLCTEEGNQTRSFCSIEVKAERDDLMEQLRHELELAENVVGKKPDSVSHFHI